jgi:hypothetical protein
MQGLKDYTVVTIVNLGHKTRKEKLKARNSPK